LETVEYLISIDTFIHDSNRHADVILPASTLTESEGTVTNCEGRVQKVNQVKPAPGQARSDRAALSDIASLMGIELGLGTAEITAKEIAEVAPAYAGVTWDTLEWEHRNGVVVPEGGSQPLVHIPVVLTGNRPPRAPLTLHTARVMYDYGVRLRHSPSLARLGPGPVAHINPGDAPGLGVRQGVSVHLVTKTGEGEFTAVIDDGTPPGVVYVPLNQRGAKNLGTDPVVRVRVVE
jgi:predicted molibdopterin-dependent oxidoreductase YjgC